MTRRNYRGEDNPKALLTAEMVTEARRRCLCGGEKVAVLAREFVVPYETLGAAIRGTTWAHLPMPCPNRPEDIRGERNANAKLTAEMVREARARAARGETRRSIARAIGVSESTINDAVRHRTWTHVR